MTIRILDQKNTARHAAKRMLMQPPTPISQERSTTAMATKAKKGVPNPNTANAAMNHRGSRYVYSLSSNYSLKKVRRIQLLASVDDALYWTSKSKRSAMASARLELIIGDSPLFRSVNS
jgi:hypothetical protein